MGVMGEQVYKNGEEVLVPGYLGMRKGIIRKNEGGNSEGGNSYSVCVGSGIHKLVEVIPDCHIIPLINNSDMETLSYFRDENGKRADPKKEENWVAGKLIKYNAGMNTFHVEIKSDGKPVEVIRGRRQIRPVGYR
jgi:hypothetical protein